MLLETHHRLMITWPDLTLPPINQCNMPCALWFYYPSYYEELYYEMFNGRKISSKTITKKNVLYLQQKGITLHALRRQRNS